MVSLGGKQLTYRLLTSEGQRDAAVRIPVTDPSTAGRVEWRRFRDQGPWTVVPMVLRDSMLTADLPLQPPGAKLEYRVFLEQGGSAAALPADGPVVIRFKGDVPLWVIIPHVLVIFMGMLFSTRTGLEVFADQPRLKTLTGWTLVFLAVGGLVFGPVMQKFAFDAYWTGWPFGSDLTDNKTAVAVLAWIMAALALKRSRNPRVWVVGAAVIVLAVFLIPHSLLGTELKVAETGQTVIGTGR
jgi:hypothetical protein